MRYLLGIDIGTSGTKTVLFDEFMNEKASHTVEYPMYQPQNGWAEQEPEDWYNAVIETIKAVIQKSDINTAEIKGIGLSGQMHGLVMLDKEKVRRRERLKKCFFVGQDPDYQLYAPTVLDEVLLNRKKTPENIRKAEKLLEQLDLSAFS